MKVAFEVEENTWFDYLVDMAIVVDIFLNHFRYFTDPISGKLHTDRKLIRRQYHRGWFWIDLVTVIPFDQIIDLMNWVLAQDTGVDERESANRTSKMIRLARLTRFARLARLMKLANLRKTFKYVNNQLRTLGITQPGMEFAGRVVFLTIMVAIVAHVTGSLWIFRARNAMRTGDLNSWYCVEFRDALAKDFDGNGVINDTELLRTTQEVDTSGVALKHADPDQVYIASVYYIMLTMGAVGYGDNMRAYSAAERVVCNILIVTGAFIWAWIVGSFATSLHNMHLDKWNYENKLNGIRAWMKSNDLPIHMMERIEVYFSYKFQTKTLFNEEDTMKDLPARVRMDYVLHRYRRHMHSIPFFRGCRDDAVVDIVTQLRSFSLMPTDYVFQKGQLGVQLLILMKGIAAQVAEDETMEQVSERLPVRYTGYSRCI